MPAVIVHFVADWAEAICGPHRTEVAIAAERLGAVTRECEVDQNIEETRSYGVLNVPAVAIEGRPESLVGGAVGADDLVARLQGFIER
jgi:hypothetical protein